MRKKIDTFLIEIYVLIILIFAVSILYLSQKMINLFFDPDLLYLPVLFQDLFYHGGHYLDWNLTPVPYFFPDWFIFFIAFCLTKNVYFQLLIVACINVLLMYLALRLIYQTFFPTKKAVLFSLTSISGFLFLSTYMSRFHDELVVMLTQPYEAVYLPNIHVGAFTVGLFYVWIQLKLLAETEINTRSYFLFFAVLISLATGMSDLLYIIQFSLPVFLAYLFLLKRKININKVFIFSFVPLLFSLLGGGLIKYIVHRSTLWGYLEHPSLDTFSFPIIKIVFNFFIVEFFKKVSPLIFLVFLVFYLSVIYIFINSTFKKNIKKNFYVLDDKLVFFNAFILFSVIITMLAIGLGKPAIRYIYPFFYFPIVNFFYIGYFFKNKQKINHYLSYLALAILTFLIVLSLKFYFFSTTKLKKEYYPEAIQCIDNALRTEGHNGVADYWQAFPTAMLSHEKITVVPIQRDLKPFNFIANIKWFSEQYSFAILDKNSPSPLKQTLLVPDEMLIRRINGEPKKTIVCGDKKLLIYPKNKLRTAYLIEAGDEFTWSAAELPSQFSESRILDTRQVKAENGVGFVTFGPNISLSAGKYQFYISYASDAPVSTQVAYWDIISVKRGIISVTPIFGTNNQQKQIEGMLDVPMNITDDNYQIRTYSSARSTLTIKFLKLVKR